MTKWERVVVKEGKRKGWWACEELVELFLWVVSAVFWLFLSLLFLAGKCSNRCPNFHAWLWGILMSNHILQMKKPPKGVLVVWDADCVIAVSLVWVQLGTFLLDVMSPLFPSLSLLNSSLISNIHYKSTGTLCLGVRIGEFIIFLWNFSCGLPGLFIVLNDLLFESMTV